MIYNRIPVEIGESRRITTRPTNYKYDEVQILMISPTDGVELPDFYQVDFCVEGDTDTVTMAGTLSGGVPIPEGLLRQGQNLEAYLVVTASGNPTPVQTRWTITIPVNERPTRSGIELSDDQQAQVDSLIAALNEGVDKAQDAADAIENMGAEAETLPEGSEASVTKTVDPETGVVTLTFGIPKGAHGDPGYSPTIMIATITGGHRITVTDSRGSASFDVMDGEQGDPGTPGDDGYSPAVTITQITGGHRVTITDKTHQSGQTFDVMDGEQGDPGTPGDDGYSPAVTITTITGGHRVTITDKTHPSGQSFDVMDGASDAGQVSYDPTQTYQAGTVGKALSDELNAISQKAPVIINTASGDIASFADGADGMQIKKIVGTISNADKATLFLAGANLLPLTLPQNAFGGIFGTGSTAIGSAANGKCWCFYVGKNTDFFYNREGVAGAAFSVAFADTLLTTASGAVIYDAVNCTNRPSIHFNSGEHPFLVLNIGNVSVLTPETGAFDAQHAIFSFGLTAHKYAPRKNLIQMLIDWQDEAGTILNGTVTLNEDGSADVVNSDTADTYHLTNVGSLSTLYGYNNIWIDTGAITECDYPADTKLYVDGLTAPDEDMIADGLIASGKYFTVNNQLYLSTAQIAAGAQIIPGSNCTATSITEALNALNT